ncbi:MAG: OmpA family protein [Cryomorphaceae bacterium]|nr:OmpA family protein [Flavobacteriales bacterium]
MSKKIGLLVFFAFIQFAVLAQNDTIIFAKPQKLGETINTGAEESLPILTSGGETMYFARTFHPSNTGGKMAGQDIWFAQKSGDSFERAKNLSNLNNKRNNVVVGAARNGSRLYLLNQFEGDRKTIPGLSYSDYNDSLGTWKPAKSVAVPNLDVKGSFYSAYVGENEDYILWTLPVEGDSAGNDLFISLSDNSGESWSEPMPLGADVNSELDEISPFYDTDRKLLFFARNKTSNKDDYDIYYTERTGESWTSWSEPVNAADLNSGKFDAYYFSGKDGSIYFSSNRNDSLSNIFLSEFKELELEEADSIETDSIEVALIDVEKPDPVLIIETKDGTSTTKSLSSLTREELLAESTNIRFVYFDFDKYNITAKYIEVLDDAGEILDNNPDINLKIIGHTDAVGSHAYNQILSENRASSTKEYLLIHGVEPQRIATEGMGKREPYASNLTEEGRALNRRVELFFTKVE